MTSTIPQSEPRKKIWLYFLDLRLRYALILLFLGLALAEWSFGKLLLLAGLAWVLGALVVGRIRPSDQELDELLSRDMEWVTEKATRSQEGQGGERRAPPLALLGPVERDAAAPARFTRPRTGRDGGRRSPVNRVVVLLPMADRLGIYSCHHDALENQISHVAVEVHHYRDVGSVILEKDFEADERGAGRPGAAHAIQVLSLELTTGRRLSYPAVLARSPEGLDRTVHAIQTLLRDYR